MKKILFSALLLLICQFTVQAQSLENPKGEVRLNFLNTIILGTIEVGYEHFIKDDQSLGIELHFNDRFSYRSASDGKDFNATSFLFSYNFYFAGNETANFYVSPFFKYRVGEYKETIDNVSTITDLNSGYIGLMGGYKWNFNNFAFGPFVSVARGFSSKVADTFSPIEFNGGFNVGYRF